MTSYSTRTLRGGRLALPSGARRGVHFAEGDLQIVDGVITAVGRVERDLGEVVDARGLLVMPGVIDPQVHFREPGATHKEDIASGSRACAAGGVTAFLEMPNTRPPTTDRERLDWKRSRAAETSLVHYGFYLGATPRNLDDLLALEGCDDCPGIKVFMGSSTGSLLVAEPADLERIFAHGRVPIAVHAEDEARLLQRIADMAGGDVHGHSRIRDPETARLASSLALDLSERYDRRLHILHLSTGDEVDMLRKRGRGGGRVSAEVTPQHLLLNEPAIYDRLGTLAQMNPPLRDASHSRALWRGLHEGLIDCIATDHAPHTLEEKALPYGEAPSGMPGVETSLAAMLDAASHGLCRAEDVVAWMTEGPARVWGIDRKGRLETGFDGDVTLVDDGTIHCRSGWNPFAGMALTGWPVATFVSGVPVYRDGQILEARAAQPLRFAR
jgi:dihydroorotase